MKPGNDVCMSYSSFIGAAHPGKEPANLVILCVMVLNIPSHGDGHQFRPTKTAEEESLYENPSGTECPRH